MSECILSLVQTSTKILLVIQMWWWRNRARVTNTLPICTRLCWALHITKTSLNIILSSFWMWVHMHPHQGAALQNLFQWWWVKGCQIQDLPKKTKHLLLHTTTFITQKPSNTVLNLHADNPVVGLDHYDSLLSIWAIPAIMPKTSIYATCA